MRTSKSRSRSKGGNNRNRSVGNVINRVFDSSGPESKVRGTPQQIIDKYTQLARDAQLSNDRVAAENFQQHGEHYIRLLGEAQREMDAKREQQEREHRERQQSRGDQQQHQRAEPTHMDRDASQPHSDLATSDQPDMIVPDSHDDHDAHDADSGLVETPEAAPPKRKPRSRKPKAVADDSDQPETPEAAE